MDPLTRDPAPPTPDAGIASPRTPQDRLALPARRPVLAAGAMLPALLGLAACGDEDEPSGEAPDLRGEMPRAEAGDPATAGGTVTPFSVALLGALDREPVNLVCSPLSAQVALAMVGQGAAGGTRTQMEEVLGAPMDELAGAANTLAQLLAQVGDAEREEADEEAPEPARASLVNGTWIQEGFEVRESFLEDLATWFGSGVFEADFTEDRPREKARERINDWVEENTGGLIEELLAEDMLTATTRLVLVNALHLKAAWSDTLSTSTGPFTTAAGEELEVDMLSGDGTGWYEDALCRGTSLTTYGGDLRLALVQPVDDLDALLDGWAEAADDPQAGLAALLTALDETGPSVQLTVPAVDIDWSGSLKDVLAGMGMTAPFEDADFSGITEGTDLVVETVVQKAVLTIDEEGMEAAAATAVGVGATAAELEPKELVLDSPFVLVAYHRDSHAPLVMSWIGDPTQTR